MRCGLIADIHANLAAFERCLEEIGPVHEFWCMGDVVGYGPQPNECIERLSASPHVCVAGNHDLGAVGIADLSDFNEEAREACMWTEGQLSEANSEYLKSLPQRATPAEGVLMVHGSPRDPIWEYVLSSWQADEIFREFKEGLVLVGHSHVPFIFESSGGAPAELVPLMEGELISLDPEKSKYVVNPGGVGQPRDRDPRASFMIFDSAHWTLEYRRTDYDIEDTKKKMRAAGLPSRLAARLSQGV